MQDGVTVLRVGCAGYAQHVLTLMLVCASAQGATQPCNDQQKLQWSVQQNAEPEYARRYNTVTNELCMATQVQLLDCDLTADQLVAAGSSMHELHLYVVKHSNSTINYVPGRQDR